MDGRSLADFVVLINRQIDVQRQIEERLLNVEALLTICLVTTNFYDAPKDSLHGYFSVVANLLKETTNINQMSLSQLIKQL